MASNLHYWYDGFVGGTYDMPPQAIPTKQKTEKWRQDTMDALERIGLIQVAENLRFKDVYRMIDGDLSYHELSEVIPQLREVDSMLTKVDIPPFLKHYDILGIIINAMVGEYMQQGDKFNVTNTDEIATTEFERTKQDLVSKYLREEFDKELNFRLIKMGINPNPEEMDIKDHKQKEEYLKMIAQKKGEMTPPEIEKFMSSTWRTKATVWAEHTLESDRERFYMDELDRDGVRDFFSTGRTFRHYYLGYDYYKVENWSPLNTFFSQDIDTKYVQDGDYVGRIHFYTPSQLLVKYGHKLTKRQKDKLINRGETYSSYTDGKQKTIKNTIEDNFGRVELVPERQYYDYNLMLDLQRISGLPLSETTYINKEGKEITVPSFFSERFKGNTPINNLAKLLRDDLSIRTDLVQVTEAYWVSYKMVGLLTYEGEDGGLFQEIITDEILGDFIKENNIKQLYSVTLEEAMSNPKPNTIVWDYTREIWKGVKLKAGSVLDEDIYIDVEPLPFQIKGDSNIFDLKLPVAGIVDKSLAKKIEPYQIGHNIAMNQMYNLLEKEIGLFYIFDVQFLPSEYKEWGDTEETLLHLRDIIKDTGLFPVDSSKQNLRGGASFNQFSAQNLSYSAQIADRMQLAEFYKQKAFEQIGFNPQRLGQPVKYTTAEGIRQSQQASYAQTEIYFDKFTQFKKRALEIHLAVAQYAQGEGKDITVYYTKSDSSKAYLKFTDPYFSIRQLGIHPITNSKKRRELETFKSYLLQNNTLGADELSLAKLFTSDTMVELINVAREARLYKEKLEKSKQEALMAQVEAEKKAKEDLALKKWQLSEISKEKDRQNRLEVERIDALGRAADNNADPNSLNFINKQADLAIKKEKLNSDTQLRKEELEHKMSMDEKEYKLKIEKLKTEMKKVEAQLKKSDDNKYIAEINKD